jgi:hypothetical protein
MMGIWCVLHRATSAHSASFDPLLASLNMDSPNTMRPSETA